MRNEECGMGNVECGMRIFLSADYADYTDYKNKLGKSNTDSSEEKFVCVCVGLSCVAQQSACPQKHSNAKDGKKDPWLIKIHKS